MISCSIQASENSGDFKCTVKRTGHISANGEFTDIKNRDFFLDKEFVVDRKTGVIVGKQFKNNIASIKPEVYDDEVNGYAVVAPSHNQIVSYLQINEFEETPGKPFIYIMTNVVLTGTCNSY